VSERSYEYDASGNVTAIREGAAGIRERQCFTYDPVGQSSGTPGPPPGRTTAGRKGRPTRHRPTVTAPSRSRPARTGRATGPSTPMRRLAGVTSRSSTT
jgi:hypothetical protein